MSRTISGRVTDRLSRDEADDHVIPEAARYEWHSGEDLIMVDTSPDSAWSSVRSVPVLSTVLAVILSPLPSSVVPEPNKTVIVPSESIQVGERVTLRVEPVIAEGVPAADGPTYCYRLLGPGPYPHAGGDDR